MAIHEIDLELINALVRLHPGGIRAVAAICAMEESNLSSALSGRRPVPKAKQPILLEALGSDGQQLTHDRVLFWTVGGDLAPLQTVISLCFPDGAELTGLWREGGGAWDMRRVLDNILLAIRDGKHRVVVKRTGISHLLSIAQPIGPETVKGLYWRHGKVGTDTMLAVPRERYGAWSSGEKISLREFDQVMTSGDASKPVTWNQVRQVADQHSLTPQDVIDLIRQSKGK